MFHVLDQEDGTVHRRHRDQLNLLQIPSENEEPSTTIQPSELSPTLLPYEPSTEQYNCQPTEATTLSMTTLLPVTKIPLPIIQRKRLRISHEDPNAIDADLRSWRTTFRKKEELHQ